MLEKNSDGIVFILDFAVKRPLPDDGIDHVSMKRKSRIRARNLVNGADDTLIPLFRVSYREQHLCLWIDLHEFFIKSASWPVYRSLIPLKDRVPISRRSPGNSIPLFRSARSVKEFRHVVTGTKTEFFKRVLQGERPCSPKPGPNDFQPTPFL